MTELLTNPGHTRSDLKQIETAIRKGWVIPDQLLEALPKVIAAIALKGKPREQIAATKVILDMKHQNETADVAKKQIEHRHIHELGPVTAENLVEHKRRLLEEIGS